MDKTLCLFPTFQIDLGKYFEGDAVKRDMD